MTRLDTLKRDGKTASVTGAGRGLGRAMAFALAGLAAADPVRVRDCKNVDTSFPGFVALAAQAGLGIKTLEGSA